MIVATAGHVDHGKTSLIAALTGVDTDRLPEEKKRGLSIDLGFAYLRGEDDLSIGFIDVPGHEKFIRNMIAGVSGIDVAVLVVAADDGPMPQTREHLAILSLLGISRVLIAISKTDLVEPSRATQVRDETCQLVESIDMTPLAAICVSMQGNLGVDALRDRLVELARAQQQRSSDGCFRLAIDRSFSVSGAGTVVTGTVFSGQVGVEQQVRSLIDGQTFRVRGIHAQNQAAELAHAGQRCALNLAGSALRNAQFRRGDWIVEHAELQPVKTLDVNIRLSPFQEELRHWTPAHLHLGTADIPCRIALLQGQVLQAGESAYARLICDRPLGAIFGDQLVLRDQSARTTIAGGRVLDPLPPARGRSRPERLDLLTWLDTDQADEALHSLLNHLPGGIDLQQYGCRFNFSDAHWSSFAAATDMHICGRLPQAFGIAPDHRYSLAERVRDAVQQWHQSSPDVQGIGEYQLLRRLSPRVDRIVLSDILQHLVQVGQLKKKGAVYCLADWRIRLQGADETLWNRLAPEFEKAGAVAPRVVELAEVANVQAAEIERVLNHVVACGLLYRVSRNRYYLPHPLLELAKTAERLVPDGLTVATFRDESGVGRNLSVEMLEFFDESRLTRRIGQHRELLQSAEQCFGESA